MDQSTTRAAIASARTHSSDTLPGVIRTVWRVLLERLTMLLGVAAALFIAAVIGIMMLTPHYQASALLKVDPSATPIAGVQDPGHPYQPDRAAMQSEVSVIRSLDMAKAVATKLAMIDDREFDPFVKSKDAGNASPSDHIDAIAGNLLGAIQVGLSEDSYVITISASSIDPERAARIANGFAEVYIGSKVNSRTGTAEEERKWLAQRLGGLGKEVEAADAQVARYKAQAGVIVGGASGTITDQQVGPIATQLASAQSDAADARAKASSARAQIARGNMDGVVNVLNSPVVTAMRTQRAEIVKNRDAITARYGPRYPDAISVTQQLVSIDDQIKQEATRITDALESSAREADARANSLRGSLSQLRGEQARNTSASVIVDSLQRNADAKRAAYAQLAKAEQDLEQAARNSLADIKIIEHAQIPDEPTSPRVFFLMGVAFLLSLFAGCAVITMQELLTRGVRTLKDIDTRLGIPLVAAIPRLASSVIKRTAPADYIVDKPMTFYAEALRGLRSALLLSTGGDRLPSVITITSSVPSEGKSSVALSLARAMGLAGDRVILVDCDVRRVGIQAQTGYFAEKTLFDVLRHGADATAAIKPDRVAGVDLIGVNEPMFTPVDLFTGEPMVKLLEQLTAKYDTVILDTPPLLGIADTRTLAQLGHAVLLVIGWDETPIDAVDKALSILQQDGARLLGAVVSSVDQSAELMGSTFYSKKYGSYYQQ